MSEYDTTRLRELGRKRQKLAEQIAEVEGQLKPEIFAATQAKVPQVNIVKWTGMARESVRLASLTPEEREATRARRRKT